MKTQKLTSLEAKVLLALYEDARDGTAFDFAYTAGLRLNGISPLAVSATIGHLSKKGLVELFPETQQALAAGQWGCDDRKEVWERLRQISEQAAFVLKEEVVKGKTVQLPFPPSYTAPAGANSPATKKAKGVIAAVEKAVAKKAAAAKPQKPAKAAEAPKAAKTPAPAPAKPAATVEKQPKAFRDTKRGIICETLMGGATNEEAAKVANVNFPGKSLELTKGLASGYRSDIEFFFRLFQQFGVVNKSAKLPLSA